MSVYVDDLLLAAESGALDAAAAAIENGWAISTLEKTGEDQIVKYCGFEIEQAPNEDGYVISQKKYEQEMVQRFGINRTSDFPQVRLSEDDEFPTEGIQPADIKTAQSMAGALLWLTTRTRPDIAMAVSAACRLATKNPLKSIEISQAVMQYVNGVRGGLHYPCGVPKETWGHNNQLHIERHEQLLEVYADIAYGSGSRHRSLQGLVVYFAGTPVSWLASQQPFVTYSTAEAELVSYCEALCAGRSTEALICSMIKEPVGKNSLERVIYGDNMAAISMAHGTGTASWRTRHLRIRSSFLKEALEGAAPDGAWKLLHLRGTDLVADGLTKPLSGQAFHKFAEELGISPKRDPGENEESSASNGGGGIINASAVRAIMIGSVLASTAQALEEQEEDGLEMTPILVAGAVLMTLGAVYAGHLVCEATQCCLRKLQALRMQPNQDDQVLVVSEASESDEEENMSANELGSVPSRKGATEHGLDGEVRRRSSSRRGLNVGSAGATDSLGPISKRMTRQSGSSAMAVSTTSAGTKTQSGSSSAGSSSRCMTSPSGTADACGGTSLSMTSPSGTAASGRVRSERWQLLPKYVSTVGLAWSNDV